MSGEYGGWIRTSQTSCNSFCLVIKETCGLVLSWWKIMCFLLTKPACFSSSATFSWSNWEQYLLELIIWFSEGAHNRGPPSNPTIYTTSPFLDEDQTLVWLVVVHFACPTISSIPHCCTLSTFHLPSQFVLKTQRFPFVSVENRRRKYGQEGFFRLTWNTNIKVIHITKMVQMIFNTWFGYFEYVGYLPRGIKLTVLN